ncbi:MAG TPA: PilZ domain-containing protein [Hyphomicrobiaceae bacterium]|jgi:hypothetical protein|nr:PilZ domain-containing protein [Hyphomicrobiaceae bacterium]
MADDKKGRDRRRSPRIKMRRSASLIVVKGLRGTATISCTILNRSKGGALIQVDRAADVPDDFYLVDTQQDRKIICSVVRRGMRLLGVKFIAQPNYDLRVLTSATV